MFKRKRLYERGDSYNDTGIPCGNPKRVQTGEVLCMPGASRSVVQQEENVETQGEEQLRIMAQKQLATNVTMHELQSQRRQFTEAGRYKPVVQEIRGVMKLQDYKDIAEGDQRVDALRQCGLTDDEIRLQLGREGVEKGCDSVGKNKSTYGANPEIRQDQLRAIDAKIKEKEACLAIPDKVKGLKEISRQEMDIEKSLFRGTNRDSNALSNLLTQKISVTGDPNDPINHLPQLMADIEDRAREKIKEKRRRRRKNRRKTNNCDNFDDSTLSDKLQEDDGVDSDVEQDGVIGCMTFEEMMAFEQSEKAAADSDARTSETATVPTSLTLTLSERCSNEKDISGDTDIKSESNVNLACTRDRECVSKEKCGTMSGTCNQIDRKVIKGPLEFFPTEYIEENRLSLEQIRKLPMFTNYEPGDPSNVLYVKNLSPCCSEHNLVSLFGRFQKEGESQIVYRLMTGHMRGQAFVTFDSIDVATQALKLVNGFLLHGKPVIVQYGKRNTA